MGAFPCMFDNLGLKPINLYMLTYNGFIFSLLIHVLIYIYIHLNFIAPFSQLCHQCVFQEFLN